MLASTYFNAIQSYLFLLSWAKIGLSADLLPMGSESIMVPDERIQKLDISRPLTFFGRKYDSLYISDDGVIVFDSAIKGKTNKPKAFPFEYSVIAPLWHDFDGAQVYYREIPMTDLEEYLAEDEFDTIEQLDDLSTPSNLVRVTHPADFGDFEATWAMVFSWFNVSRFGDNLERTHTFQTVLVSDESATFAIFLYSDVQNAANSQVGVNSGQCSLYYTLCISMKDDTNKMMKLRPCDGDYGVVGFRIDTADMEQNLYMCTPTYMEKEDRNTQCECSSLDLPASEILASNNRTKVGDLVSYTCADGYIMVGEGELACLYNGTAAEWEGYERSCKKLPIWISPENDEYASVTIKENALPDSNVFDLIALAGDGSSNITYSFEKQIPSHPLIFGLFENQIKVAPDANLDVDGRNIGTTYILHFRAKDNRFKYYDQVSADAYLIVNIADVNDNHPVFVKNRYSATIEGNRKIGSTILAVTAIDDDITCPNNEVHYQFGDQDHPGYFSIDPWDGVIKLIKQPEFLVYEMTVTASDGGSNTPDDGTRVTIFINSLVATTTTMGTPVGSGAVSSSPSSGMSTAGVIGILVAVVVVVAVAVGVFLYRRRLQQQEPTISASFKTANANVALENPNFVSNDAYIDDRSFSPAHGNSTNESQPGTEHDFHCDTAVLTTDSWQKEKERKKMQK